MPSLSRLWTMGLLCAGCAPVGDEGLLRAEVEEGEWLPGGETTNTLLLGSSAFLMPAANLSPEHEAMFYSGNAFFSQAWVEAPASTASRDGLGPLFNARSCSTCHFRDGRAAPPEDGQAPFEGLLLRLSVASTGADDTTYGGQLQDQGLPGIPAEAAPTITWTEQPDTYPDGTPYSLLVPTYTLTGAAYGAFSSDILLSPRIAPHRVGLGLLEAIPAARLEALADPDDRDGDGLSGRLQVAWDREQGTEAIGRFGWKAEQPTVLQQSAGAFSGDLGITSRIFPEDDCTEAEVACLASPDGGTPELEDDLLDRVGVYARAVAVPVRRAWDDDTVLRGKLLFGEAGCTGCHVPCHETEALDDMPELGDQRIWPYTDLLLHDMGPGLADGRPVGVADGQEWRTPPLWGVGLFPDVSGHSRYLHDGRARSLEEAILWHGGEADESRLAFMALPAEDRDALLVFLEDL